MITLIGFEYPHSIPLGIAYLNRSLEASGTTFAVRLFKVKNFDKQRFISYLSRRRGIVAISCMTDMLPHVVSSIQQARKYRYGEQVFILGGPGPRGAAAELLDRFDDIDFIIVGDGTRSLPLVSTGAHGREGVLEIAHRIPGLVYRQGGVIHQNSHFLHPDPAFHPSYEKLPLYNCFNFFTWTSWGCPFSCTYCDSRPFLGKKILYRNIDDVLTDVRCIRQQFSKTRYKTGIIHIIDEAFLVNRARVIEICHRISRLRPSPKWTCFGRIGLIDRELIRILSKSGCISMYFGIESGSNKILKKIRKGFTIEQAFEELLMAKTCLPEINAAFIFRYPFETIDDFESTIDAMRFLQDRDIQVTLYPLAPVRGTPLYEQYSPMLKYSVTAPCVNTTFAGLDASAKRLIKNNKYIFSDYYYYACPDLLKIMKRFEDIIAI